MYTDIFDLDFLMIAGFSICYLPGVDLEIVALEELQAHFSPK